MHWRGIVQESWVTLRPCYDAMWVALHTVAIATDLTSYRHTDPMYPLTLLPLLSTPAPLSFLQLHSKKKKAIWLKSKYFFHFKKIRIPEIQSRRQGSTGKCLFPKGQEALERPLQEERLVTFSHPPPCLLSCSFLLSLFLSWLHRSCLSLSSPPPTPCLDSSTRQSYNIIQRNTCGLKW